MQSKPNERDLAKLTPPERTTYSSLLGRVALGPRGGTVTSIDKAQLRKYLDLIDSLIRRLP